jgi:hypothetical protein
VSRSFPSTVVIGCGIGSGVADGGGDAANSAASPSRVNKTLAPLSTMQQP